MSLIVFCNSSPSLYPGQRTIWMCIRSLFAEKNFSSFMISCALGFPRSYCGEPCWSYERIYRADSSAVPQFFFCPLNDVRQSHIVPIQKREPVIFIFNIKRPSEPLGSCFDKTEDAVVPAGFYLEWLTVIPRSVPSSIVMSVLFLMASRINSISSSSYPILNIKSMTSRNGEELIEISLSPLRRPAFAADCLDQRIQFRACY